MYLDDTVAEGGVSVQALLLERTSSRQSYGGDGTLYVYDDGSPLALQLCRKIQESEDWEDDIEEIVEDFSAETGRTPFYTVCFY